MEDVYLVDINDDMQLFCLHYIYTPHINRSLHEWKEAWIRHPMSSEKNKTPMQLWTDGLLSLGLA